MKSYKIEFEVEERSLYYTCVSAETPEKALELWKDNPCTYDAEPSCTIESEDIINTAECVGEWEEDKDDSRFSSLKRYDEPIKLNEL